MVQAVQAVLPEDLVALVALEVPLRVDQVARAARAVVASALPLNR